MHYRREIDGLRALAVLPVILFHAGFQSFSGGFVGVDVFFVISGYLITTIILSELEQGKFSIVNFYERRARRILPALFLVMLVCLLFAWFWLLPSDMKLFAKSVVAVSLFSSNILFWLESGYFDTAAELKPLLHTWSLAVEEQYYVLFPLFLMVTWRFGKRKVLGMLAVAAVLSLSAAQWGSVAKPTATFFLLPTRGWELLIGAFIAFYLQSASTWQPSRSLREVCGVVGLAMLGYAVFAFSKQTPFPSLYALVPTVGTALIILFATKQTTVGKFIGNKLFVGIGLISYSAYLWHQPIFAFARQRNLEEPSKVLLSALAIASIVLAYFSWKFVEAPFRHKRLFNRNQIFSFATVFSVAFLSLGLLGYKTNGVESRLTDRQKEILFYGSPSYTEKLYKDVYRMGNCFLEPHQSFSNFNDFCSVNVDKKPLLIWGDSHAAALSYGLRKIFNDVVQYNASGCPPLKDAIVSWRPQCKAVNDFVLDQIKKLSPWKIILHANWSLYKDQDPVNNIHKTVEQIQAVSPSTEIIILGSVPHWYPSLPVFMVAKGIDPGSQIYLPSYKNKDLRDLDAALLAVAKKHNVSFISSLDFLCNKNDCLAVTEYESSTSLTAWDYGHLTEAGSVFLANKIFK